MIHRPRAVFLRDTCHTTNGHVSKGHVSVCAFLPKASILRATCLKTNGLLFEGHVPSDQKPSFSGPRALRHMASFLRATRHATQKALFLKAAYLPTHGLLLRATCPRTSGLASRGHAPYDKRPSLYGPNVLRPGVMDTFHPRLKCGPVSFFGDPPPGRTVLT